MKTKKELKAAYRQHRPIMGVYQIENTINGKLFLEASIDIMAKWNRHQTELKFGSHRNISLQNDWNEFKAENFNFKILTELAYKEDDGLNYRKEVKLLKEMLLEEMNIPKEKQY